ncbi:hypothetical protein GE300_03065 [Rhodobacteraceae bacterium 2CG4]|uniref:Uncharacterized protein n=1 Tax=Halovulum marinum TaxID=2662447 RepID=A0A6L5YXA7_9RHOB|nr:DUF6476 family protein [Halovulum marinum]MSU88599.1 hypothetical protein [Halovulum marinum]
MTHADTPDEPPEPPRIRRLRLLVTALTAVMMIGMVIVVGLLVWRLGGFGAPRMTAVDLPAQIALPAGERLTGFARNPDWLVLITETPDGQRLHLAAPDGSIRQSVEITATPD